MGPYLAFSVWGGSLSLGIISFLNVALPVVPKGQIPLLTTAWREVGVVRDCLALGLLLLECTGLNSAHTKVMFTQNL